MFILSMYLCIRILRGKHAGLYISARSTVVEQELHDESSCGKFGLRGGAEGIEHMFVQGEECCRKAL